MHASHAALRAAAKTAPAEVLISLEHVAARFGRSVATIENWLNCEELEFPRPKILKRRRYFSSRELEAWEQRFSDGFAPRVRAASVSRLPDEARQ